MRLITLEEHYRAPMIRRASSADESQPSRDVSPDTAIGRRLAKLDDVGAQRLADMDPGGIDYPYSDNEEGRGFVVNARSVTPTGTSSLTPTPSACWASARRPRRARPARRNPPR